MIFRPDVSFAAPASLSPISGEPTPTDVQNAFSALSSEVNFLQATAQETHDHSPGLTPEQEQALLTLVQNCIELKARIVTFKTAFAALPGAQQAALIIGTTILMNRIGIGLDVLNDWITAWDATLPGIPAFGIVDGTRDGMDSLNDDVQELRDDMDGNIPGTGTVLLAPVILAGEAVELALVVLGTLFD
jgi:hypothetical protein